MAGGQGRVGWWRPGIIVSDDYSHRSTTDSTDHSDMTPGVDGMDDEGDGGEADRRRCQLLRGRRLAGLAEKESSHRLRVLCHKNSTR